MENSMIEEPDFNGWAREYDDEEPDIADDFGDVDASAAVDADAQAEAGERAYQAWLVANGEAVSLPAAPPAWIPLAEYLASDDVAF